MHYFAVSLDLTGPAAFLALMLMAYVFVYLPLKLIVIAIAHAKQKADYRRMLRQKTVIAEYEPPAGFSPAELGYLYDLKLQSNEIFATILDLQQKGLVDLSEVQGKLMIGETRQAPTLLKSLDSYILGLLGEQYGSVITNRLLEHQCTQATVLIKQQLQESGYIVPALEQLKRSFFRLALIVVSLIVATALFFRPHHIDSILAFILFVIFMFPGYVIVSIFLYRAALKIVGEPWLATPQLKQVWPDIEGYREFINTVELDNLKFESENNKSIINDRALPYAVALGFNTGWQEKIG